MLRLYDSLISGNGYKARLLLAQLGTPYERIEVDILRGESRTPDFLEKNPNGRIPLLETEDGRRLAESNAILFYLAEETPYLPADRWARAQALQWMCFEQYNHEPNIAVARHWLCHLEMTEVQRQALPERHRQGYLALDVMERHLSGRSFFAGEAYSIADIALYAYTHVADEGGFDLASYGAVREWLERVRGQPGHIPISQG